MENSWYIKQNEQHHFFCTCGTHDIIENYIEDDYGFDMVEFKREEIDFSKIPNIYYPDNCCSMCGNEHYLDMTALLFENITRYWSDIKWEYEEKEDKLSWSIVSFMQIPLFNEGRETITFKKLKLSTYTVGKHGTSHYEEHNEIFFKNSIMIEGKYYRVNRIFKNKIYSKMVELIVKQPIKSIEWLNREVRSMEQLTFFLKYPNIRSKDIFFWKSKELFLEFLKHYTDVESFLDFFLNHRSEKSLRKAQFISYEKMMKSLGYNPMADYIFSRTIHDENHLLKVLNMDIEIKQLLFDGCQIDAIIDFINFLKNFYQDKHIVTLWLSINKNDLAHFLLRDSSELFLNEDIRNELYKKFRKTPLNIKAIHDELIQHSQNFNKLKRKELTFSYSDTLLKVQGMRENIEYRLPRSNKELYSWGGLLHNCLFSYDRSILNHRSTIFGLFIDRQLMYAIEIRKNKIVQASTTYNKHLDNSVREKIDRWYKEVYMPSIMGFVSQAS
jgi:hypothetical protein